MKIEKNKHDHKLTNLLKVCIFAMLMIAPLFASCSQMLYVTCNKNAKDSYYGETINQLQFTEIKQDNFVQNEKYTFIAKSIEYDNITINRSQLAIRFYLTEQNPEYTQVNVNQLYYLGLYHIENGNYNWQISDTLNGDTLNQTGSKIQLAPNRQLEFVGVTYINSLNLNLEGTGVLNYYNYNKYSYLSESFYYGVETMTESPLFNWTQNTALYTGIKAMTDNLQVQTNVIAVLVTYWTILTIIYIIIDIVLALFTKMTHLLVRSD